MLFKDSLKEAGVFSDKDFEKMDKDVAEVVERSVKFADESPLPPEEELFTDVYAD